MPGFIRIPGNVFFSERIAKDKSLKRCVGGKPTSLRSISKFFCKLHLYGWTGKIKGKPALMFAGTGSCNAGTATEKFFLAVIGAVTGDTAQTDSLVLTATDQFSGSICSSFFRSSINSLLIKHYFFVTVFHFDHKIRTRYPLRSSIFSLRTDQFCLYMKFRIIFADFFHTDTVPSTALNPIPL